MLNLFQCEEFFGNMLRNHQSLFSDRYDLPYNEQSKLDPMSDEWKQEVQAALKQELLRDGNRHDFIDF